MSCARAAVVLVAGTLSGCFGPRTQAHWTQQGAVEMMPKSRAVALTATCSDSTAGMLMPAIGNATKFYARGDMCASGTLARAADQGARLELEYRGYVLEDAERINAQTGQSKVLEHTEVGVVGTQWRLVSTRDLRLF